jgi:hypothetical protein
VTKECETLFETRTDADGVIRVECWPEGLVLWVGGVIRWKQWKPTPFDPEDLLDISKALGASASDIRVLAEEMKQRIKDQK